MRVTSFSPFLAPLVAVTALAGDPIDAAALAGLRARSIGPAGMSGRVTDVACVETDPNVVWVAAATGGVWRSDNGGSNFEPMFDDQPVHAIGSLAIQASNPDVVWVGTGEGNVRNSASVGNGVYRTNDGGRSWQYLGLRETERIPRILLHPTRENVAYVAALGPEWGESSERGVYRTVDGGRTFVKLLFVNDRTGCADLVMDPSNPDHLFAAMWQFRRWPYFFRSGGAGSGLYETFDGGATWRRLEEEDGMPKGELGRIGIGFCRSHPEIVYALVEAEKSALLRSEDGGRTFATANAETNVVPRPFYFADLRVDPVWPNRVYCLDYVIRVSYDAGRTFRPLPGSTQIHGDYHAMWIDPRDPDHIWVGEDGGVGESRDRGRTMRFITTLPLAQFYHVAVDDAVPYNVMGGLQDNSSWRGPNTSFIGDGIRSHEWRILGSGDGFDVQPDPTDPNAGYAMSQGGYLVRWNLATGAQRFIKPIGPEGVKLRFNWNAGLALDPHEKGAVFYGSQFLHRSSDRGETFAIVSPDLTTNRPEWQRQAESGGLTPDVTSAENHCTIIAIAPSPVLRGVIWVGTDDGRLQITRDGGSTWASVEANVPGVPANTWISHVEASRFDPAAAFVVFDDHRRSNVATYAFATNDYGATWRSLVTPDVQGYALVVEQDPVKSDMLWLGTEYGLFLTLDGGVSWTPFRHGLPTASVMDLVTHPREHDLVIATHGRSLYVIDDVRPLREVDEATLAKPLHLFPVAPAQQFWRAPEVSGFGLGCTEYRGTNRAYGALLTFSLSDPALPLADPKLEKARKASERAEKAKPEPWEPRKADTIATEVSATEKEAREPNSKDAKDAKAESEPKARITITAGAGPGAQIRSFEANVHRGMNRVAWDLRRDDFERPAAGGGDPDAGAAPPGAEVPPGEYTVRVKYGASEATTVVRIVPDPRATLRPEESLARYEAILAAGRTRGAAARAIERITELRRDTRAVLDHVREEKRERDAEDAKRGVEPPPAGEPTPAAGGQKDALVEAGEALLRKLDALEKKLWPTADSKGIVVNEDQIIGQIQMTEEALASSPDLPSSTHRAMLDRARTALAAALVELKTLTEIDVQAFAANAKERGVILFATKPAVEID